MHTPHPDNPAWHACQPIVAEILDELEAMEWPAGDERFFHLDPGAKTAHD
jgi:hypothetical protein